VGSTKAFVLIKTELGTAKQVAQEVANLTAVLWAVIVTGPYDIVAAAAVDDNHALGTLVVDQIQQVAGVTQAITQVATESFYGLSTTRGNEMFP
jgi:DNA-binding Lrp family transcriptional regulator